MNWKAHVRAALDGEHDRLGRGIAFVLYGLIVFSVLSIGVESLPDLPAEFRATFAAVEVVIVGVFTIEYLLRIVTADRKLSYIFSFWGLIDLVAVAPFYLSMGLDLRAVRGLRLLRLFRLFKMVRYSGAAERLAAAVRLVREELIVFGLVSFMTLYLCAIGIYYFENEARPEAFSSVFSSMWWAAVTLTTVGYGDVYPITTGGRIFTVFVLFVALGVVAIPTGLVSAALTKLRSLDQ